MDTIRPAWYVGIVESTHATEREYRDAIAKFYATQIPDKTELTEFLDMVEFQEEMAKAQWGAPSIEKSNGDNLIVKWFETSDAVMLMGLVTKRGSIHRSDADDVHEWVSRLSTLLMAGKTLYTSPNRVSRLLLRHLRKDLARHSYEYVERAGQEIDMGESDFLKYQNVSVTATAK